MYIFGKKIVEMPWNAPSAFLESHEPHLKVSAGLSEPFPGIPMAMTLVNGHFSSGSGVSMTMACLLWPVSYNYQWKDELFSK